MSFNSPPVNQCVIQKLAPLSSEFDEPCTNEFDYPLLQLTNDLPVIPGSFVIKSLSVLHCCTESCKFFNNITSTLLEHEQVVSSKVVFLHDPLIVFKIYIVAKPCCVFVVLVLYKFSNVYIAYIVIFVILCWKCLHTTETL